MTGDIIKNKYAYFASYLHYQVHYSGIKWIKDCGIEYKYKKGLNYINQEVMI